MESLPIKTQTDSLSSAFIFGSFLFIMLHYSVLSCIPFSKSVFPISVPSSFSPFLPRGGISVT